MTGDRWTDVRTDRQTRMILQDAVRPSQARRKTKKFQCRRQINLKSISNYISTELQVIWIDYKNMLTYLGPDPDFFWIINASELQLNLIKFGFKVLPDCPGQLFQRRPWSRTFISTEIIWNCRWTLSSTFKGISGQLNNITRHKCFKVKNRLLMLLLILKEATRLNFMHCSFVVIILFNTD